MDSAPQLAIDVRQVSYSYGTGANKTRAIENISLQCAPGEFIAVVGPSGCGKSTLLSLVAGLNRPESGTVCVGGQLVDRTPPSLGIIFQKDTLLPWRTVLENVELGLEVRGMPLRQARPLAMELLARYGLAGFEEKFPHALSGGMRKRAQLIQALAVDPDILLLDEAFSALDAQTRVKVENEFLRIQRDTGKTVMMVTHDIAEAISMADRVVVLSARPARVKAEIPIPFARSFHSVKEAASQPGFEHYYRKIWDLIDEGETAL